jgi:hypothetical protein
MKKRYNSSNGIKFMSDEFWSERGTGNLSHFCWRYHADYGDDLGDTTQMHPRKGMIRGAIGYGFRAPPQFAHVRITRHSDDLKLRQPTFSGPTKSLNFIVVN